MINLQSTLEQVKSWALAVGKLQLNYFRTNDFDSYAKSTAIDLVTDVDRQSEALIINNIEKHYHDHAILAEESGSKESDSDYCWVIDPLDGATNFISGIAIFSISIALKYRGQTILGVVYLPYLMSGPIYQRWRFIFQ